MSSIPEFDQSLYRLGKLCKNGHAWGDTEQSLRYISTNGCFMCLRNFDMRTYQQNRRAERLAQGLCARCGKHARVPGIQLCAPCQTLSTHQRKDADTRRHDQEKQQLLRAGRKAQGLCQRCGVNPIAAGISHCRACMEKQSAELKARRLVDGDSMREQATERRLGLRKQTIAHYGNCCACCGETELWFLCIDHIDGKGNEERRATGFNGGHKFYGWLRSKGYPPGYRVLCWNCNSAIGILGYCPHQQG